MNSNSSKSADAVHIPLITMLKKGWKLARIGYSNKDKRYRRKQQWKIFYHILISQRFASKWFNILKSDDLSLIFKYRPTLYIKPFRVYMSTRWNNAKKIKVIEDTYRFILQQSKAFLPFITESKIPIAHLQLSDEYEGFITLEYDYRYRKEGELVMAFTCEQLGGDIAACAFSFEKMDTNWICRIGCVQGQKRNDSTYSVKTAQKMLHGLRPKALVVFAVQEFVRQFGFASLYGTGDSIQAYRRKHAIYIPIIHDIHFDYNSLWNQLGGHPFKNGWYELPLTMERKDIKEFKTSKRALHRRQYEMLDYLSQQISDAVSKLKG